MASVAAPSGREEATAAEPLAVTVVVPVRDEAADLAKLLDALEQQTVGHGCFRVVVADDGSLDPPATVARPHIELTAGPRINSYAARNRAAALVRAPVLAFCDADCRPEPEWLRAGLAALERADVAAGLVRFVVPARRTVWTLLDIDMYLDQERSVRASCAATANLFVRRSVFDGLGGFDDALPNTADYDLVRRCVAEGNRLVFVPDAVVWHPTRDRARSLLGKQWAVNYRYAEREAREGRRPRALKLREWVPLLQPLRSRRRFGRSIRLDRTRLAANGVTPTLREDVQALPLMYLVMPYLGCCAQLYGWWKGRTGQP